LFICLISSARDTSALFLWHAVTSRFLVFGRKKGEQLNMKGEEL
jgi:hypothetical protein